MARAGNVSHLWTSSAKGCSCWQPSKDSSPATVTQPGQLSKPARLRKPRNQRAGQAQTQMKRGGRVNGGNDSESGNVNSTGRVRWVWNRPLSTQWLGVFFGTQTGILGSVSGARSVRTPDPHGENLLVWNVSSFPFFLFAGYTS